MPAKTLAIQFGLPDKATDKKSWWTEAWATSEYLSVGTRLKSGTPQD
ncbi:hypothetical protein [Burkholderia gladioli]